MRAENSCTRDFVSAFHSAAGQSLRTLFCASLCLMAVTVACAQRPAAPAGSLVESEAIVTSGSSIGNVHVFAYADDRRINPIGVEYDRNSWGKLLGARVDYVGEVLPVVLLEEPALYGPDSRRLAPGNQEKYGFGVSPIGVRLHWRRGRDWQPYLIGKGGILLFTTPVLSPQATRLNFSAQFGAGVEKRLTRRLGLRLGYSDFHFSNGDDAARNPGIDFMYFNAGLSYRLGG